MPEIDKLISKLKSDPAMAAKLKEATNQAVVDFAKKEGINISGDSAPTSVDESELAGVAGGCKYYATVACTC